MERRSYILIKTTLTVQELANILEISESTLKRKVVKNQIPFMRIKNRVKFVNSVLIPWIQQKVIYQELFIDGNNV
jgi:excisionase family DNA binding protein